MIAPLQVEERTQRVALITEGASLVLLSVAKQFEYFGRLEILLGEGSANVTGSEKCSLSLALYLSGSHDVIFALLLSLQPKSYCTILFYCTSLMPNPAILGLNECQRLGARDSSWLHNSMTLAMYVPCKDRL